MGIFSSIVSAIGDAIHWVDSNSGLIGDAAKTIAGVAGAVGLLSVDDDENTGKNHIMDNYKKLNSYLEEHVQKLENCQEGNGVEGKPNRSVAQLTGLWTDPVKTGDNGEPSPEMYRDVARMFSLHDFHPVVGGKDVPQIIAQALAGTSERDFHPPEGEGVTSNPESSSPIKQLEISYTGDQEQPDYHGYFLYYPIPMGKGGNENAWHGSLYVNQLTSATMTTALRKERERLFYFQPLANTTADSWCLTFEIDWQNVLASHKFGPELVKQFPANGSGLSPDLKVEYSKVFGEIQTVKLQAPATYTPAGIRAKVIKAVDTVMGVSVKDAAQQKPEISTTVAAFRAGRSS